MTCHFKCEKRRLHSDVSLLLGGLCSAIFVTRARIHFSVRLACAPTLGPAAAPADWPMPLPPFVAASKLEGVADESLQCNGVRASASLCSMAFIACASGVTTRPSRLQRLMSSVAYQAAWRQRLTLRCARLCDELAVTVMRWPSARLLSLCNALP